jgi:hypothetical protein
MWIRIAVPAIEPIFTDHSMTVLHEPGPDYACHRYGGAGPLARGSDAGGFRIGLAPVRRA